ncbi:hypothetical protein HKX48_003926 [Thoreauomyces humboldtii]|nr:hypothetical protein HKX48_003926 [Thoreauomyces humboldtii]
MSTIEAEDNGTMVETPVTTASTPAAPNWPKLEEKLQRKMHHIWVSLKRSGKKGRAFAIRAMVKKSKFYRYKLDKPALGVAESDPVIAAANRAEWERQLAKFDEDLTAVKTLDCANLLQQTFLATLRKSALPEIDRLLTLWDTRDNAPNDHLNAPEDDEKERNELAGVGKSTEPAPELSRLEQRIAATEPIVTAVADAVEDLFVVVTGRGSGGEKKPKVMKPVKKAVAAVAASAKKAATAAILGSSSANVSGANKRKRGDHDVSSTFVTSLGGDAASDSEDDGDNRVNGGDSEDSDADDYGLPPRPVYDSEDFSGGESSEEEVKRKPPAKKEKKNRKGQQARRAIAERKFGQSAQHVATGKLSVAAHAEQQKLRARQAAMITRATTIPVPAAKSNQPAHLQPKLKAGPKVPLHPSWEAKRKAKEAAQNAASAAKPVKIVFGEDSD